MGKVKEEVIKAMNKCPILNWAIPNKDNQKELNDAFDKIPVDKFDRITSINSGDTLVIELKTPVSAMEIEVFKKLAKENVIVLQEGAILKTVLRKEDVLENFITAFDDEAPINE